MSSTGHFTEIDQASIREELSAMFEQVRKRERLNHASLARELAEEIGFPEQGVRSWLGDSPDGHCMYRMPKAMHAALFKRLDK